MAHLRAELGDARFEELRRQGQHAIADDVATREYDVEEIRRRFRPTVGTGPAQLAPVRMDPERLESLRSRAARDHANNSEFIRAALREHLAS